MARRVSPSDQVYRRAGCNTRAADTGLFEVQRTGHGGRVKQSLCYIERPSFQLSIPVRLLDRGNGIPDNSVYVTVTKETET